MVTVIIGRDHRTNQLYRMANGKAQLIKQEKPVPTSVSKEHISLTITDDGKMILKNLNVQNYTFVNMVGVESKLIQEGDRIELGTGHYVLDWNIIKSFVPKYADIRPLKKVWEDYQQDSDKLQIKQARFGVLRGATGILTMASIAIGRFSSDGGGAFSTLLYVIGGIMAVVFIFLAWDGAAKAPQQKREITDSFTKKYVCPNCGHFLGNNPYNVLAHDTKCHYCQAIFKK